MVPIVERWPTTAVLLDDYRRIALII